MAKKVIDESPLGLEISELKKKIKEYGPPTLGNYLYKTALRIAKARQRWEEDFLERRPFFQQFYIGFITRRSAIFQIMDNPKGVRQWCGSFVPWNKHFGNTVEEVLKDMLGIKW
jgi:hypothetical protein